MALGTMTPRTEGIRKQASELIEQAYQLGYQEVVESCAEAAGQACKDAKNDGITEGRNEAWEAARKLVSMRYKKCKEVLGDCILGINTIDELFVRCTASEAIEKLRAYEEQKKQEEDSEIHVGDEVIYNCGNDKNKATVIDIDVDVLHLLTENGCYISEEFKDVKKTNRNFPEIAEVLKKMQEDK